ncbi:MAG: L-seryl-tRNA(Sec) selenium transferase, partial [Negativicutes bacterium]
MLNINARLRNLPAIDKLLAIAESRDSLAKFPQSSLVSALRNVVDNARQELRQGNEFDITPEGLVAQAAQIIVNREEASLQRVVNATGVVLHTNLGRAPLSARAASAVNKVMTGYSTLEYNIADGQRGTRYSHIAERIARLVGSEDAIVVNNNAAAVLLVLST